MNNLKNVLKSSTKTDTQSSLRTSVTRKQYSATFKAQIVLEALRETKTIAQIASEHQLHPNLVTRWKQEAIAELPVVFERKNTQGQAQEAQEQKVAQLYEQIGRLTTQLTWIKKNLVSNLTSDERLALAAPEEKTEVPLLWQAELLSVSRSRLYSVPRPPREQEILVKHRLDQWYTQRPCLGSRKLVHLLAAEGMGVGRHTIRRYRAEMGLETQFPRPNLSAPSGVGHTTYPYLLRGLAIERPNQVWGFIGVGRGYYLRSSAWRPSISGCLPRLVLAAGHCLGTLGHTGDGVCPVLHGSGAFAGGA